eukprot:CAMPEP_0174296202 /NCGR_PEP_ID=MMETSP0809-20121228/47144_1 /TAXON_ID=73025 ORGANISM="Eutreptiella gymnastica-like, Strain CCMP1594" /NCGR_SAMPLE_ID=MMETSP0809 /ASSEMBLY_ACC=CAM_ASM_000658 /LENGTH=55 /DNA_ID=CAMNT_0015399031 /DNA_START=27 /DNA_END=191 /DNA_ORIENTATION=-
MSPHVMWADETGSAGSVPSRIQAIARAWVSKGADGGGEGEDVFDALTPSAKAQRG